MVDRLKSGDIINIFPRRHVPRRVYRLSGLVQEGFTGAHGLLWNTKNKPAKTNNHARATKGTNIAYPPIRKGKESLLQKYTCISVNHFN